MNKGYICIDGKVIINDDKNSEREPIYYYEDLEKELLQENLVETMVGELEFLHDDEIKLKNRIYNSKFFLESVILFLVIINVAIYGAFGLVLLYGVIDVAKTNILYLIDFINKFMVPISIVFGGGIATIELIDLRALKRKLNGVLNKINYLEKEISLGKENLKIMKKKYEVVKDFGEEVKIVKINDKEVLEELDRKIEFKYDCGYNRNKYYKYYKNGNLDEKLGSIYTEEEIKEVEEYLTNQIGPVKVKRKELVNRKRG